MNESERPSVGGLMDSDKKLMWRAAHWLHAYEGDSPIVRDLRERLTLSAQPVASNKATDEQVTEWAGRYDLGGNLSEWRCMFEDAQTLIPAAPSDADRKLRAIFAHWNEFGPEHGFGELLDRMQDDGPNAGEKP